MGRNLQVTDIRASVSGEILTTASQVGPATPTISSPPAGILSSFTPTFVLSAFASQSSAQTHSATNLQLATDRDFNNRVYDSTAGAVTSFTLPAGVVQASTTDLYARVRYLSSAGFASNFSPVVAYTARGEFVITPVVSGSNFNFQISYVGPGSVTSARILIANNYSMSSPAFNQTLNFTNNTATATVASSSIPGYAALTTPYYLRAIDVVGTYSQSSIGLTPVLIPFDQYLTTSGSFTTAAGFTGVVSLIMVGGGGGGSSGNPGGAGGGGGGIVVRQVYQTGSTSFTYTIGAGGLGATSWSDNGTSGGNTTITLGGSTFTALGGIKAMYNANAQAGGTAVEFGTAGGNHNSSGQNSLWGGRGGTVGNQDPNGRGGEGGYGYGAGGGGQTRVSSAGGSGGGGGGGGGFGVAKLAVDGNFVNVGYGGNGAPGLVIVRYNLN